MSLFEYLAAAYVLMLSLALIRGMSGVAHALLPARRSWIHISWLGSALGTCLAAYWAFWSYREIDWTIFSFMLVLAIPAILYSYTALLVPTEPSSVESWRKHFDEVRARFFLTGVAMSSTVALSNQSTVEVGPLHPSQIGLYSFIAMYALGALSARPAAQVALAVTFPMVQLLYVTILFAEPDSLFAPRP